MARLQMETTLAVLGQRRRYPTDFMRTLIFIALMLPFISGCHRRVETLSVKQLATELHNSEYRWHGPCSREDRIPVLHAARELAYIGDEAVPVLLDAIEDPTIDFASIHDALSEIGLPVSLFYDQLDNRDATALREWWSGNADRTRDARSQHRLGGGLPVLRTPDGG